MKRVCATVLVALFTVTAVFAAGETEQSMSAEPERLRLATTTSTENSGLLDELLPAFESRHGARVDVIAVGTGQALELGRNGDVDVVMVHAPELEREFVREGYGVERVDIMYNDFVVLGPESDPAGIADTKSVADAFARIAESESAFISRGDNSGTHAKERAVWAEAGIEPDGSWYREAGQGMGAVITVANDQEGYTLADRGTYLAYRGDIGIDVVVEGDPLLFNPYAVIAVDPEMHDHVKRDLAQELIDFLVSDEGQDIIGGYRVEGEQLFVPDA
ncbi:MAG: substrate-binding domain-containing protein, partial [Spirochaetaceae bacterium]